MRISTLNRIDVGRIDGGEQHFDQHFGVFRWDQRLVVPTDHLQRITVLGVPEYGGGLAAHRTSQLADNGRAYGRKTKEAEVAEDHDNQGWER